MLRNLRNRLFASYLVVLIVALSLVGLVTITTLSQREAPPEFTWNRLELLLLGFTSQRFVSDLVSIGTNGEEITDALDNFADDNTVRVMVVGTANNNVIVFYDSGSEYSGNIVPHFEIEERSQQRGGNELLNNNIDFGRFVEANDEEWLFAGFSRDFQRGRSPIDNITLLIAEPRSNESVQTAVSDFNDLLLAPLLRSAAISGVVALVFAIFLTRSIVRPLQVLSKSAQHVAKGEFGEEVPETGPVEIQQVASAFNRMTGEVLATQQSQREFMANVSHDLKTPLTSIQGYSQAIMDGAIKDPSSAAKIIHDEAERLNRMVQELTDLARLQAGRLSMKMTALDVGEVAAGIGQRLTLVAAKDDINLQVRTGPMPMIAGDGDRMVQVLTNLIGNAIKYTPAGGEVQVMTGVRNGGVEIIVRDNGMGIPAEDLPHIFDRFYQVDKSRGPKRGTGLGLAITQEIVQAHGGKIDIQSAGLNQGTTVTVWLPSPHLSTIVSRRVSVE